MLNIEQRALPTVSTVIPFPEKAQAPDTPKTQSDPVQPDSSPAPARKTGWAAQLADKENLKSLGQKLQQIAAKLGKEATPQTVLAALGSTPLDINPGSSYAEQAGSSVTLESFITKFLGLPLPSSHFHLTGLYASVTHQSMEHPLGDLGGALSWPVPLSADEQQRLRTITMNQAHALGDQPLVMQTKGGVLEFLRYQHPIAAGLQDDPAKILEALLSTPQAQLMGKDLQERMQGVASNTSVTDYLLAAIALQLDPESITAPDRNKIAGFDLASNEHWGKPASSVIDGLTKWLSDKGKTTPEMAKVGAYLLLANRAPVYLIKDIPDSVKYGSPAWINLAVAAATIEARTPGKVPNMTFAQVMLEAEDASLADPNVTQAAQREALIDWGKVNGLPSHDARYKDDHLYTAAELDTLVSTLDTRRSMMAIAAQDLDEDLPSRQADARAVLKERFPELEGIYEQKSIHISRAERNSLGQITGYRTLDVGPHSLLDIAMMDLSGPDLVFSSDDKRIPVEKLNADPHFGVANAFEQAFKEGIEKKKSAVNTYIKHLISQLPVEDRKNFEFGEITFFQNHTKTLGTGFFGSSNHAKGEALLVKIKRDDGVEAEYKIDFNAGRIEAVDKGTAAAGTHRNANRVYETKEFKPAQGAELRTPAKTPAEGLPTDTFASHRVQLIADAFVEHINFDDDAIKQQARGQTTADRNNARADVVNEFLLDLIPFRSAINSFRAGNIGEGLLDLGLDLFGFVTAGVATAGKVVKIAGTAASRVTKGLRAAKAIGMATFSTLNPLGGLGDAAVGGVRMAGKGLNFVGNKAHKAVSAVRGATGSYDVLKAVSKEHGTALIGTYTAANRKIDTVAVLKNDKWYHYDPVKNTLYGAPITDFTPLGSPMLIRATGSNDGYFRHHLKRAQSPSNAQAYERGLTQGSAHNLPGYRADMSTDDLAEIALHHDLSPEQMGSLVKELTQRRVEEAKYISKLLYIDVDAPGVHFTPVSQIDYLALTNIASRGECAGLSNLMALAIMVNKQDELMQNLYRAARNASDPKAAHFIQEMENLQRIVGDRSAFHMGKPFKRQSHQELIDELTNSPTSKTIRIATKDHAMIAGIKVEGGKTSWFFYDPNAGLAQFTTLKSMQEGMEKALNSGKLAATLHPHKSGKSGSVYETSDFTASDMDTVNSSYKELLDLAL